MGLLLGNDEEKEEDEGDKTVNGLSGPYHIDDGVIYDSMGNPSSINYDEIEFPRAKIGVAWYELVEQNGFFIPRNGDKAWKRGLIEKFEKFQDFVPKGYLEAVYELHGPCPDNIKDNDRIENGIEKRIKKSGGKEMYNGINRSGEDVDIDDVREIIENTVEKAENESLDISVDSEKLVILVKAYVSGVLTESSKDWVYLEKAYDNLFYILDKHVSKEEPLRSLRYAESMMDIQIPTEEYKKIQDYSNLSKETSGRSLTEIERGLQRELY
jgi:hypothetical protein